MCLPDFFFGSIFLRLFHFDFNVFSGFMCSETVSFGFFLMFSGNFFIWVLFFGSYFLKLL